MKVIIVIVTYNAMKRDWIEKCLTSLRASTVPAIPVVIDNCSSDATVSFIQDNYPEVVLFPQQRNLGFGQGNNVGIRYAIEQKSDFVLLLNQDAFLAANAIEELIAASNELRSRNGSQCMLSPLHLSGDGTRLDANCKGTICRDMSGSMIDDAFVRKSIGKYYKIDKICAACWFIPIDVIHKIGGFNKTFFHYGEDNNYAHRLLYHGIDTYLVTTTYMLHDRGKHGCIEAYNNKRVRRDIMISCCNINLSFGRVVLSLLKDVSKLYREELPRHNYTVGSFLFELICALFHIRAIRASRRVDCQIGHNWL